MPDSGITGPLLVDSHRLFVVRASGAPSSAWPARSDSQFPVRTPIDLTLFTRLMPAQIRREQPVIDRLSRQLADGRHADDDRRGTELAGLESLEISG